MHQSRREAIEASKWYVRADQSCYTVFTEHTQYSIVCDPQSEKQSTTKLSIETNSKWAQEDTNKDFKVALINILHTKGKNDDKGSF